MIYQIIAFFNDITHVSEHMLYLFKVGYVVTAVLTLAQFIPIRHLFFTSLENRGYIFDSRLFKKLGPNQALILLLTWISTLVLIALDVLTPAASLLNLFFSYSFFVSHRWSSISRGFGAPGFITYWGGAAIFLITITESFFPSLIGMTVFLLRFDFAIVLITAGVSKILSGYPRNHGIQYGLVNPMWGYFPKAFVNYPPKGRLFQGINHLGWIGQSLTALFLLIPPLNEVGGGLLALMFLMINLPVRLGPLCFMLMIIGFLYQPANGFLSQLFGITEVSNSFSAQPLATPDLIFFGFLAVYIIVRPFTVLGLWCNFYLRKTLPGILQKALELYTNTFGIILWRVFTADLLNFWVDIHRVDKHGKSERLSKYEKVLNFRFNQVCESIAITCIFTSLKYYPDYPEIFADRLKKYVQSLRVGPDDTVQFKYYDIDVSGKKFKNQIRWIITTNSSGDIIAKTKENDAPDDFYSATKAGFKPGTYAPSLRS